MRAKDWTLRLGRQTGVDPTPSAPPASLVQAYPSIQRPKWADAGCAAYDPGCAVRLGDTLRQAREFYRQRIAS